MRIFTVRFLVLCLVIVSLYGCKAAPGRFSNYVDHSRMAKNEELPFNSVWIKKGVDLKDFAEIYISRVDTSHMLDNEWYKDFNRYGDVKEDAEEVADFARDSFKKAFKTDPNHRFKVVSSPGFKTVILEIAITELTPNKPGLKAAGFVPIFGWGAKAINQLMLSSVAIEGRLRDGATGEIVAMFADREQEKLAMAPKSSFTWYGHAYKIIEDWAEQFVIIANRQPHEVIEDSATFDLSLW